MAQPVARQSKAGRLRIGYFSADFFSHATMHLMAGLFRAHDAARFAIHAYSYGPARDDAVRLHRSEYSICFLHPPGYSYFAMLRQKLQWSERPKGE